MNLNPSPLTNTHFTALHFAHATDLCFGVGPFSLSAPLISGSSPSQTDMEME